MYAGLFCGICFVISGVLTVMSPGWAKLRARRQRKRQQGTVDPETGSSEAEKEMPTIEETITRHSSDRDIAG